MVTYFYWYFKLLLELIERDIHYDLNQTSSDENGNN